MKNPTTTPDPCPCGGASYAACCRPYHLGTPAPDAEALMRSRYSAFVCKLEPYLLATWHSTTRPTALDLAQDSTQWLRLEVKRYAAAGDNATVEFVARYKTGGRAHRLHEISRFVREGASWFYIDGKFPE